MKKYSNIKPFGQLLWLAFVFLMLLIITSGITLVLPYLGVDISSIPVQMILQGLTQVLTFFLSPVVVMAFVQEEGWRYFRFRLAGRYWRKGGVAFVMVLLLVPVIDWLTVWNEGWSLGGGVLEAAMRKMTQLSEHLIEQFLSLQGVGGLVLNVLVLALIPAVCEELFFRGGVQQILQRWFKGNAHLAVWVTAVFFSLCHGDIFGFVPRLLLGVVLGYLFVYSGSLLVNVCAHFANNVLIVLLSYGFQTGLTQTSVMDPIQAPWLLTVLCAIGAGLLFYLYIWKKEESGDDELYVTDSQKDK